MERGRGRGYALLPEGHTAHFDEILGDFGDSLLALVDHKVWPVDELFVDLRFAVKPAAHYECIIGTHLLEGLGIVVRQPDLFPHVLGCVGTLDRLDVQVQNTLHGGEPLTY